MAKYNRVTLQKIFQRVLGAMSGDGTINVVLKDNSTPHYTEATNTIETYTVVPYARTDEEDFQVNRGLCLHEGGHKVFAPSNAEFEAVVAERFVEPDYDFKEIINDEELWLWLNVFLDVNNDTRVAKTWDHLKSPLMNRNLVFFESHPEFLRHFDPMIQVLTRCYPDDVMSVVSEYPDLGNGIEYAFKPFVEETVRQFKEKGLGDAPAEPLMRFSVETYFRFKAEKEKLKEELNEMRKLIKKLSEEMGDAIKQNNESGYVKTKADLERANGELNKMLLCQPDCEQIDKRLVNQIGLGNKSGDYSHLTLDELKKMLESPGEALKGTLRLGGNAWGNSDVDLQAAVLKVDVRELKDKDRDDCKVDRTEAYKIGRTIHRILKAKIALQDSYETRHKNGLVDIEEATLQISKNGKLVSERLFSRPNFFTRGGEFAVEVLIDLSGSMGGDKICMAKQALATLGYSLDGLPNVHYALTGFTHDDLSGLTDVKAGVSGVIDVFIKRFLDKHVDVDLIDSLYSVSGNCDGVNIRSACKRLLKFRNMKKLLIVISDGQPAYQNGLDDTKKAVELCEKYGVSVIGIGIEGSTKESLQYIYPRHYKFNNTKRLPVDLSNLILSCLGQRKRLRLVKNRWEV